MAILCFEYVQKYMMKEGTIENILMIFNQEGSSITNMPHSKMKAILGAIAGQYKCRSRAIFALNSPRTFSILWQVIRYFIDQNTARKVQIVSSKTCP